VREEVALELGRRHLEARALDELLDAVRDGEHPRLRQESLVASVEEALLVERLGRRLVVVEVCARSVSVQVVNL